ncbi:MAG TPA: glutamate formimidoyltransferase [Planctomycetota bacterium]|nr:glutamate formimidoyltransferase [Planctomycetota bacterium]
MPPPALVECVPNFSEGRRTEVVDRIVAAAAGTPGVQVLDRTSDASHNRSVITLVGAGSDLVEAAVRMGRTAAALIDLREHTGEHPRMGATDVVPFVPVSGVTMAQCVELARECGRRFGAELGIPVFLYESAATRPERKNLADVREGQFEGLRERIGSDPTRAPDFGPPHIHPTAGVTAVGARKFLIAYNVNLASPDVKLAKRIAKAIREKDGGFKCVKAMGFHLADRDLAQVSMNMTDYETTSLLAVYERIEGLAAEAGVKPLESELVGLAPAAALPGDVARRIQLRDFDPDRQIIERRAGLR